MTDDQQSSFEEIARQALGTYDLESAAFTYLQHSENVTFKVDHPDGGARLLRIHTPYSPALGNHGANVKMVESELLWLEALRQETDLPIQQPVRNRDGHLVTRVRAKGKRLLNCTLLEWLEGEPYSREFESEETVAQIGVIVTSLHRFSRQWKPPTGFIRPRRDRSYFMKALEALKPTVDDGRASYQHFKMLETSVEILVNLMRSKPKKSQLEGILHGDLHKDNFLYHQGQIRLIDFSMSAMGNYMFDLGVCLSDMSQTLHPVFLEQYQMLTPLPADYARLIEAFFLGSMVATLSFWVNLPDAQENLVHTIPLIAREYATKLNRDERFWLTV